MNIPPVFTVIAPDASKDFEGQMSELNEKLCVWMQAKGLSTGNLLATRVYFSDLANRHSAFLASSLYSSILSAGAVSIIEQPPLCGAKIALQLWFNRCGDFKKKGTADSLEVYYAGVHCLFQSVRFSADEVEGKDTFEQTEKAFRKHMEELSANDMTLEANCHRTWIYVRDIDRHYAAVVKARNSLFGSEGLTADNHYIASTGIGGYPDNGSAAVSIDFFSADGAGVTNVKYLHATDYLNPTHEYGVAFERATEVDLPDGRFVFISGTASIDKYGDCLFRGDVVKQAERLFLNIEKLLEDADECLSDLQYIIVYLRDISDYQSIKTYIDNRFPSLPCIIVEARVCRPEWLIEVEGIAVAK